MYATEHFDYPDSAIWPMKLRKVRESSIGARLGRLKEVPREKVARARVNTTTLVSHAGLNFTHSAPPARRSLCMVKSWEMHCLLHPGPATEKNLATRLGRATTISRSVQISSLYEVTLPALGSRRNCWHINRLNPYARYHLV